MMSRFILQTKRTFPISFLFIFMDVCIITSLFILLSMHECRFMRTLTSYIMPIPLPYQYNIWNIKRRTVAVTHAFIHINSIFFLLCVLGLCHGLSFDQGRGHGHYFHSIVSFESPFSKKCTNKLLEYICIFPVLKEKLLLNSKSSVNFSMEIFLSCIFEKNRKTFASRLKPKNELFLLFHAWFISNLEVFSYIMIAI